MIEKDVLLRRTNIKKKKMNTVTTKYMLIRKELLKHTPNTHPKLDPIKTQKSRKITLTQFYPYTNTKDPSSFLSCDLMIAINLRINS